MAVITIAAVAQALWVASLPAWGGGESYFEVIETDCSIRVLRLESDGGQPPSQLPS